MFGDFSFALTPALPQAEKGLQLRTPQLRFHSEGLDSGGPDSERPHSGEHDSEGPVSEEPYRKSPIQKKKIRR